MDHFSSVFLEQNNSDSLIVFEINKIGHLIQKTSVGEYVKSSNFELNFKNSIGKSSWVLILFPNGQYDCNGMPNKRIFVYLKMINCEKMSTVLKLDVKFQLGSGIGWNQHQNFCFNNVRTRWTGTHLVGLNVLSNRDYPDDTAVLSLYLKEHSNNSVSHPIYENIVSIFRQVH